MTWPGVTKRVHRTIGRGGGTARLGGYLVPKRIEVSHTGENGEPDLFAAFEVRDGRPECVEFQVTTKANGRGIRTTDLHLFNLDAMAANVFAEAAMVPIGPTDDGGMAFRPPVGVAERQAAFNAAYEARKARRGTVTRAELERVAEVYRQHVRTAPTKAVAEILGYDERTAARRVQRARQEGLLPPTTPGKRKA